MSAVKRLIERSGRDWKIQYWIEGPSNAYRRHERTLAKPKVFKAIRTETAKEITSIEVRGEERTLDAQLLVNDDLDVGDIEDTTKISPVITSPTGVKYDAIALGREGELMKFHRIFLSKRRGIITITSAGDSFDDGFNEGFEMS